MKTIKLTWEKIVAIIGIVSMVVVWIGNYYVQSYRVEQLEQQIKTNQQDIQWLLEQSVKHGWRLPAEMIGH